jgi:hypothetical protein
VAVWNDHPDKGVAIAARLPAVPDIESKFACSSLLKLLFSPFQHGLDFLQLFFESLVF